METREQLEQYAACVWAPEYLIEIRPLPPDKGRRAWIKSGDLADQAERMGQENAAGANLFAGVLPRLKTDGGSDADCGGGFVLWADFDHI